MAVLKSKRQPNKLHALGLALEFAVLTLQNCKSEKIFPKRDRWLLTAEMVRTALGIYIRIRRANRVRVEGMEDYNRRMALQCEALELIEVMLGLIDVAAEFYNLPDSKEEEWTGKALELEAKARAWHRQNKMEMKPGSIQVEAGGMAVDAETLEHILLQAGTALAQKCAAALPALHGPGAV